MTVSELLGTEYPIICGAMARISTYKLVSAVAEAGGLGIIASGGMDADTLRNEIRKTREITEKPFGVNLMLMTDNIDELVDVVIAEEVAVVTTGAGSPEKYMDRFKQAGIKVIPVIASVKHAKKMEAAGADAVVAEGQEAGGHIGQTSVMSLLPQVVDAVSIPVLGAGGIGDGRALVSMAALGAQGYQAGTIFLTSEECPIPDSYKQAILDANDTETVVTGRKFGDPVRSLTNELQEEYLKMEYANEPFEELQKLTVGSLSKSVYDGDIKRGSLLAGEIAGMFTRIQPAKEIIETLFSDAEKINKEVVIPK